MAVACDVVGLGLPYMDVISRVPRLPGPDESLRVLDHRFQGGGKVATALVAASRLGLCTAFIGPVGGDLAGEQILEEFRREGVDVQGVQRQLSALSPVSTVLVTAIDGARSILWWPGTVTDVVLTAMDRQRIRSARYLMVSEPTEAAVDAARCAQAAGVTVVADADHLTVGIEALMPWVDVCIASTPFVKELAPQMPPDEVVDLLPAPIALVTLGAGGVVGRSPTGRFRLPAYPVPVLDTLGAGDVFHGAYVAGLHRGYNPEGSARYASAAAALQCRTLGGRSGIASHDEVLAFMGASQ